MSYPDPHPLLPTSPKHNIAASRLVGLGSLLLLAACGSGFGLQKIDESLLGKDTAALSLGGDGAGPGDGGSGDDGSGDDGSGNDGSIDTGFTGDGSGSGGSGSSGSGSSGSGSSGSGSSGSGSSGSGSSGSGSSGSGSSGSGSSGSGSSGSGSGGTTDADGDGFDSASDCNDSNASIYPGAIETCDGLDNDCDGLVDADDPGLTGGSTGYLDADGDGYGTSSSTATVCSEGSGYSYTAGDCDDSRYAVHPGAAEVCDDGLDNDCSGADNDSAACSLNLIGAFVILYGAGQPYAGYYNCGLLWDLTGTENASACPSCDLVFDISAVYDATAGYNDGSCSGMSNFTATWAYDSDYYGSTPAFLELVGGTWNPITTNTRYRRSSGYWEWGAGTLDYAYSYWFYTYYYTYYQYQVAYVY